jgi:RNA polymerase sigma-70 factor (ECF subfamily)
MRKYQDMVFTTSARLVRNDAQAEDISQEVFIKAHEHFEMLSTSPTAGGWLKTVATNLSLNHLQRYRNRWKFFSEFGGRLGRGGPRGRVRGARHLLRGRRLGGAPRLGRGGPAKLPDHQRVPLVLYHFEDIPYDEIARRLGVSLAKVKTDILRARGGPGEDPFPRRRVT